MRSDVKEGLVLLLKVILCQREGRTLLSKLYRFIWRLLPKETSADLVANFTWFVFITHIDKYYKLLQNIMCFPSIPDNLGWFKINHQKAAETYEWM